MQIKNVILDLDGTIADTIPLCIAAFKKSIEPLLGTEITREEIVATFGPSEEGTIRQLIPAREAEGIMTYLKFYKELHYICPFPFPGIKELLDILNNKGVKLAMVTGKGIHSTNISLQQFGLTEYFKVRETGSPEGPDKINGIRKVLSRLNANPDDSIYIGDAPSDIAACKEAGISIAAAAWANTADIKALAALNPNWMFYTIDELKDWIINYI